MTHPHLPGSRPIAVPGIGFPQNISVDPEGVHSGVLADLSDKRPRRPLDRIVWLPLPCPWFAVLS
jgi:hypothetical protein